MISRQTYKAEKFRTVSRSVYTGECKENGVHLTSICRATFGFNSSRGTLALFLILASVAIQALSIPKTLHRLTELYSPLIAKFIDRSRLERTAFSRPSDLPFSTPPCLGTPRRCSPPISSPANGTPLRPLPLAHPRRHPHRRRRSMSISGWKTPARGRRPTTGVGGDGGG